MVPIVGFALGPGLSVLLVGLGILYVTVVGVRYVASFERGVANALLGTDIPTPDDVHGGGEGLVATAIAYLQAPSTWRGLGFVFLKFWIGVLSFVLLVSLFGTGIELVLLPVLALLGLHVLNAFAGANALIASSLLGPDRPDTDG